MDPLKIQVVQRRVTGLFMMSRTRSITHTNDFVWTCRSPRGWKTISLHNDAVTFVHVLNYPRKLSFFDES